MNTLSTRLHYIFRVACAMCFIGHGAFGIITKKIWCNYFGVFGIPEGVAYQLMPVVGIADIAMGIVLLLYPVRIAASWLIFWGLFTASLRPLSGEHVAEFLERAGNYGAPLILLMLSGAQSPDIRQWFKKIPLPGPLDEQRLSSLVKYMQAIGFTLLAGHGWLNLTGKAGLLKQYEAFGFQDPHLVATIVGSLEILGALIMLVKPVRQIILLLLVWKMVSELFYPAYEIFEWVERGGSYAILLGLWMALKNFKLQDFRLKNFKFQISGFK